jgi:predicted Zn-dependent peptidase
MALNPSELKKGLDIVFKELQKIRKKLISDDEMKRIKNITKTDTVVDMYDPDHLMIYFGLNVLYNRNFSPKISKYVKELNSVTKIQLKDLANEIFQKEKSNIFIKGPLTSEEIISQSKDNKNT